MAGIKTPTCTCELCTRRCGEAPPGSTAGHRRHVRGRFPDEGGGVQMRKPRTEGTARGTRCVRPNETKLTGPPPPMFARNKACAGGSR